MKVFKFGGASLQDAGSIKNVASIIKDYSEGPLVVVFSAIGNNTNELEKVVEYYYRHQRETAAQLLFGLQKQSLRIAEQLIPESTHPLFNQLHQLFSETEWQLGEKAYEPFDYYYDQLLSRGELISSMIVNAYLNRNKLHSQWLDVRGVLRTDSTHRDARIEWEMSQQQMDEKVKPLLKKD